MKTMLSIMSMVVVMMIGTASYAQDKEYKDGSVWAVSFIKVSPNMGDQYLKSLKTTWNEVHKEAVKQGLIVSYKVLAGAASNPEDWDFLLMTEYKSLASMEGNDDKWEAIYKKIIGGEEASNKLNESRVAMRTIYGEKLLREITYN